MIFKRVLSALILVSATGCILGEKTKKPDYGPEVSDEKIEETIDAAVKEYDANKFAVGEWAQLDETRQFNGQAFLISDMAQSAVSSEVEEDPANGGSKLVFRVVENRRFFDVDLNVTNKVDTEFPVSFRISAPATSNVSSKAMGKLGDPIYRINETLKEMRQNVEKGSVTFHNLVKTESLETPPPAVANSSDCASVYPNCKIKVYTIGFDMVFWTDSEKGEVLHREYKISPQVPLLGLILSECLSGIMTIENDHGSSNNIYVKECTVANNFKFGSSQ